MKIKIDTLYNHREYQGIIFEWLYSEWGNNNPLFWKSWINSSIKCDKIPISYIVFDGDTVIGTFSLWQCDLQSKQDLFPWFGGFYLKPTYRGKMYNGIKLSYIIQNYALLCLKRWGYSEVYLFTEKETNYYGNNGWVFIGESFDEHDRKVFLYKYNLKSLNMKNIVTVF